MITNGRPLYVQTMWAGPTGLLQSRFAVQPGGTVNIDGESTISIARMVDRTHLDAPVQWEADITRGDAKAPAKLEEVPCGGIDPSRYGKKSNGPSTHYLLDAQSFKLPWMPGDSHLTMIARNIAGQVLSQEDFTVRGVMSLVKPTAA